MKAISQFVLSVVDLIEAEGRQLRTVIRAEAGGFHTAFVSIALGIAFLLASVPLLVGGVSLMAAGLMWWLEVQVSRPMAAVLTGLVLCVVGFACLLTFRTLARRKAA